MTGIGQGERAIDWVAIWVDVARRLAAHHEAGRRHLLTEDSMRMCTVLALDGAEIGAGNVAIDVLDPALRGGKLDMVIDVPEGRIAIELKYPRASRTGTSPDTMTLGEVLRDFLRVALVDAVDRWVVIALQPGLRAYLWRRRELGWTAEPGRQFVLSRELLEKLPKTAFSELSSKEWLLPVIATCVAAVPVDSELTMLAYRVDAPSPQSQPGALVAEAESAPRPGARQEILDAVRAITSRTGRAEFTAADVVRELRRTGSRYPDSTIRTQVTSHMCAQSQGPGDDKHTDLDRVGRGYYRLREVR